MGIDIFWDEYPTISGNVRHPGVHEKVLNFTEGQVLLELCRKQDRSAQKTLYEMHFQQMMTVCQRYLKSEDDAREVLNDAFLKVFSKIHQFKSEGSLAAWIKRIVINTSIDFVRSNKSYKTNFIHTSEFKMYGNPAESDEADALNSLPDLSKEEIFRMVEDLPPATRIVFNLYVIDEFTHKQIAKSLNISEGTSKWHLSNARKILRKKINRGVVSKYHGEETK
ncbi:sigma-70 family RNA polymerase sigma factor [soil metagenome]